jgi:hypothetical protein
VAIGAPTEGVADDGLLVREESYQPRLVSLVDVEVGFDPITGIDGDSGARLPALAF